MQRTVLWMVRRSATVLWAAAGLVTMTSRANADEEHWITDAKGCKFQNTHLLAHGSVAWSGACVAGYAEGEGILSWTHLGKPNGSYEGVTTQTGIATRVNSTRANTMAEARTRSPMATNTKGILLPGNRRGTAH